MASTPTHVTVILDILVITVMCTLMNVATIPAIMVVNVSQSLITPRTGSYVSVLVVGLVISVINVTLTTVLMQYVMKYVPYVTDVMMDILFSTAVVVSLI